MVVLFILAVGTVQAQTTWQYSQHENSSINFSYSGFDDALLDYITPVQFRAVFQNLTNDPIDNSSGYCSLNFSSPFTQIVELNYSGNGLYSANLTASNETLDNAFQVYCVDSANSSHDHVLFNGEGAVTFQYDLYEPIIVDVYTASNAGSQAGSNPLFLAGQPTTLYALVRNITGTETPINITSTDCNISVLGQNRTADSEGFEDFYTARFILPKTGNLSIRASCFLDQKTYISLPKNLTVEPLLIPSEYDLGEVDWYFQPILMAENGSNSFLASIPYTGSAANTQVRQLGPTMSLLLDRIYGAKKGSFGFVDLFNQGSLSLLYSGLSSVPQNIFSDTQNDFNTEFILSELNNFEFPSFLSSDLTGNGFPDFLVSGLRTAQKTTTLLVNNGSNLASKNTSLLDLQDASICYGDFDSDSRYDLFVSGQNSTGIKTNIYLNNGTDFTLHESLPTKLYKSTCAIGRFLDEDKTSLIHFGTNDTSDSENPNNWQYVIYNDTRNWTQTTSGLLAGFNGSIYGDVVVADFSGDGLSDIFLCGGTAGHETLTLFVNDINETGTFVPVDPFNESYALPKCSMSAADYDFDGDLDLAYTGVGTNGEPIMLFNNTASLSTPNTPPLPPAFINGSWNESSGTLWVNWSAGSDTETPQGMLSYNLEVESGAKGLLLSGQPAITSKPAQGYLGNMQYRLNTTLYNQTPEKIVVRIQSIDAGLRRSTWAEASILLDACKPKVIWNISTASGCVLPDTVGNNSIITVLNGSTLTAGSIVYFGTNTTIRIVNGTLDLTGSVLQGNNTLIEIGTHGHLLASSSQLNGINLSVQSSATLLDSQLDHFHGNASAIFINTTWNTLNTSESVDVRFYYTPNFRDQFDVSVFSVSLSNETDSFSNISRLNLTSYLISETETHSRTHNLTFHKSGYYNLSTQITLTENTEPVVVLYKKPVPDSGGFNISGISEGVGGNYSTDLAALSNASNISIARNGFGTISFLESVNLSFVNLSQTLSIQPHSISLNSSLAPGLNRVARLTFENLTFAREPIVLRNGVVCDSCFEREYNGSVFNVTVFGFSTYSLENNSQISLTTPSVLFNDTLSNFSVNYHAYGNSSNRILNANCEVTIDSGTTLLAETNSSYSTQLLFNEVKETTARVECLGNSSYEPINQTFTLNIVRNGVYFLKDSEYIGLRYSTAFFDDIFGVNRFWATGHLIDLKSNRASISFPSGFSLNEDYGDPHSELADLNNDGWTDLVVMGTSSAGTAFNWYDNQTEQHSFGLELSDGDFGIFDIDYDGDLDVLACGKNASGEPQTILLKNQLAEQNYLEEVSFIEGTHTLPDMKDCSLEFARGWLVLAGKNSSDGQIVSAYKLQKGEFQNIQDSNSWLLPELSILLHDITQDGTLDLILAGKQNSVPRTSFFQGNGSGFELDEMLSSQLTNFDYFGTRITVGRLTNETNQSLLISGITDTGLQTLVYGFNGSDFIEQDLALGVEPTYQGTLTLGDIDSDSDLDLWITGQSSDGSITHLYTNTLAEFAGVDQPPSPPASIGANYSNNTLHLNWSAGSDLETPETLLSYSLSIGSIQNQNHFLSGVRSSDASGLRTGNQGNARSANLSLPDACFSIRATSIDVSYQASNWSASLTANNHTEICNGYDNDCDGLTDEDFFYPGTNLFTYNGSINGTPFTCTFYESYTPEQLSCPSDPTKAPGDACNTATYTGAIYQWNQLTKKCDCDLSSASLKNVLINSVRTSRASTGVYLAEEEEQTEPEGESVDEEDTTAPTPSSESASSPKNHFTTSPPGFEVMTEVDYQNGWTVVTNHVRNTDRTLKEEVLVSIEFDKSLTESLKSFRSVNDYQFASERNLTVSFEDLDYLEEAVLLYSIPGHYDLEYFKNSRVTIEASQKTTEEALAKIEEKQRLSAEESITTNISETVENNKTVIRLDIDLKENISQVHGIEIEQEIPKCLIEEITDSILESAIDPALLAHVEIKEADPLLVWRFDRLEDAVNLELTLDALRTADCEDEVTLKLLAKSFIYQNQPINKLSVMWVLIASLGLVGLILSPVILASLHKFHQHDNPHVVRLAKIILRRRHKGVSDKTIINDLLHNDESDPDIRAALAHLDLHQPSHHGLLLYEHRVEIALFVSVLILSIMEMGGWLPGYLDWFKKVLSWAIMLLVVHHANLARLFFNEEAPRFSVTLMLGMFLMHLVRLAEFASDGLTNSVGFVFDWYVLIVRLDAQIYLSWIFFTMGLLILTACAIYAAKHLPVRERSLGSVFFKTPEAKSRLARIGRMLGLLALFCVFFFSVFNRMIEWLAIAVDSALFVLAAIILMALSLSMIAHHHGHRSRHHWGKIGELLADEYLLGLGLTLALFGLLRPFFPPWLATLTLGGMIAVLLLTLVFVVLRLRKLHEMSELEKIPLALDHLYEKFIRLLRYPRTLVLALAGLLVLQLVVESALYIIPNITGKVSHLYGGHTGNTLLSLFGNTGMISQQLFMMSATDAVVHAFVYVASFLGLISLLLAPVWVWAVAFQNRGHGIASGSVSTWMHGHHNWTNRLGRMLIVAGLPLSVFYIFHPVLTIESLFLEGSAGVRFIPHLLQIPIFEGITALLICLTTVLFLAGLIHTPKVRSWIPYLSIGGSFMLLIKIYFIPFVHSIWIETVSLFGSAGSEPVALRFYPYLLGTLQAIDILLIYLLGGICVVFLLLPVRAKRALVGYMRHLHPFDRIFELAENEHLLEYYDEARSRFAGNLVHHLEHYIRRCTQHGISRKEQVRVIQEHGYPKKLITKAIDRLHSEQKSA